MQELQYNKKLILEDIQYHKLPVFNFLDEYFQLDDEYYDENDEEDETVELNRFLQKTQPFAVMGSNTVIKDESTGELKRVRKYPWGVVDIFDNEVSDFLTLKNTLLITHLNDFKDYTHEVLYENYRIKTLGEEEDDPEFINGASSRVISLSKNAGAAAANSPIMNKYGSERFASNSPRLTEKEREIQLEEERLRAFEERVQKDLLLKRQEIEQRERELAELEKRLKAQGLTE
ncbi:unnamed protein product [Ambrosiozyma monospora]|uniref:Unnamed protein product n=1 Tax=Ambrosiozyma monospora TaxID=43982 RepID=A0A9W6Z344_AMBMO|nr:unnamed protein product [Ambrosiozyma monospora]